MKYNVADIEEINATEDNSLIVFFRDNSSIETVSVEFYNDGTFTVAGIIEFKEGKKKI